MCSEEIVVTHHPLKHGPCRNPATHESCARTELSSKIFCAIDAAAWDMRLREALCKDTYWTMCHPLLQ